MQDYYNVEYGDDIIAEVIRGLPSFLVSTTRTPWNLVKPKLDREPQGVALIDSLEIDHLAMWARELPLADCAVGIGGAAAMDGAKYLSLQRGIPYYLIPTTVSNNACLTDLIGSHREGMRQTITGAKTSELVVIDYSIIRQAPLQMNRSGLGELLCHNTAVFDWKLASSHGYLPRWDSSLADESIGLLERAIGIAAELRDVSKTAIDTMIDIWKQVGNLSHIYGPEHTFAVGSDHPFSWNLVKVTDGRLLHSEAVSLGDVIISYLQDNQAERIANALVEAEALFLPDEIGSSWDATYDCLRTLPDYIRGLSNTYPYTIIDEVDFDDSTLANIRDFLEQYRN